MPTIKHGSSNGGESYEKYHKPALLDRKSGVTTGLSGVTVGHDVIVCVEVLRPSQPNGVMSSAVSLPNHTFTGQV